MKEQLATLDDRLANNVKELDALTERIDALKADRERLVKQHAETLKEKLELLCREPRHD